MAKHKKPDDPKPGLVDLPPETAETPPLETAGQLAPAQPEAVFADRLPAAGRDVDPLDVPEVHRLRVAGRLYRVKLKHPAGGQALVEADSADAAVAAFVAARPDAKAADCRAEKLKP